MVTARETGRRVASHRVNRGLSQRELAKMVGVDHSHISRIESGARWPARHMQLRIARALRVSHGMLFGVYLYEDDIRGMVDDAAPVAPEGL